MLINYFIKPRNETLIIVLHALLGVGCLISKYVFIAWLAVVLAGSLKSLLHQETRGTVILYLSGYFFGLEIIARMVNASPIVPYYLGNYFMIVVFLYGILSNRNYQRSGIGLAILILCFPGFFMIASDNYLNLLVNSFSGILCLGLCASYFSSQRYTFTQLVNFIKCLVLPIIIIVVYVMIRTPDLHDIDFGLYASFETTGGFGTNQVSTIFGVGACLLLVAYMAGNPVFQSFLMINFLFIAILFFRGFLTFSRGGMISAISVIIVCSIYLLWSNRKMLWKNVFKFSLVTVGCALLFLLSNEIAGGNLLNRYHGETPGTLGEYRDRNLGTITSNRSTLAMAELNIFFTHPYLGVGPGGGYDVRSQFLGQNVASHTEVTRLLAEQGIPGLAISLCLLIFPFFRISKSTSTQETYYLIAFFSLAILSSFHSGMRTMITPLLWGLACARFWAPSPVKKIFSNKPAAIQTAVEQQMET